MSIIFIWSVVVNIVGVSAPIFLSLRINWFVVLSSVGTGVTGGVDRGIGRNVSANIFRCVASGIDGDISSSVGSSILLSVVLVWSVVVDVVSASFPRLLSFGVDWFVVLSGVGAGVASDISRSANGGVGSGISR